MPIHRLPAEPPPVRERSPAQGDGFYRMYVRDLVLLCNIGAYPEERHRRQRVSFNIDMRVVAPTGPIDDDLTKVLSYDKVISNVRELVDRGHINLVETLAERVAESCLADPRVADVRVRVEKLDIEPAASGIGIEIERRRQSYPAAADLLRWDGEDTAGSSSRRGSGL